MPSQEFSRISLHLHGAGGAGHGAPILVAGKTYIDIGNVVDFEFGDYASRFRFDYPEAYSSCIFDMFFGDLGLPSVCRYRVNASTSARHNLFLRLSPYAVFQNVKVVVKCGSYTFSSIQISPEDIRDAGNPEWVWIKLAWLPPEAGEQDIEMMFYGNGYVADCFIIAVEDLLSAEQNQAAVISTHTVADADGGTFAVVDDVVVSDFNKNTIIDNFSSEYTTVHVKILDIDDQYEVVGEYPIVGVESDVTPYAEDGWVNFGLRSLPGFGVPAMPTKFGVAVTQSPASPSRYFVWDEDAVSASDQATKTLIYGPSGIFEVPNRMAVRVYAASSSSDACIQTSPAIQKAITITDFDNPSLKPKFTNTASVDGGLALNLPERTVVFVIDQSGSMSWSDKSKTRYDVASNILSAIDNAYPGRVNSVISTFQSDPIKVEWFAVTEEQISTPSNPVIAKGGAFKDEGTDFYGVQVVRRYDRYPVSPTDGDIVANGLVDRYVNIAPDGVSSVYYGIYPYDSRGVFGVASYIRVPMGGPRPPGIKSLIGREMVGTGIKRSQDAALILHMDEGGGEKLYDFSYSSNHASVVYGVVPPLWVEGSQSPPTPTGIGKGFALRLNGRDQYVKTNSDVGNIVGDLTFAIWIYGTSSLGNKTIIHSIVNGNPLIIYWDGSQVHGSWAGNSLSIPMSADNWHRVAWSYSRELSAIRLYVGSDFAEIPCNTVESFYVGSVCVGADPSGVLGGWFGRVSELSVHASFLSDNVQSSLSAGVLSDNGDRAVVLSWFVGPHAVGKDGMVRIQIKRTKELGHLRVLNEDIAGASNVGSYSAPVDWGRGGSSYGDRPASDLKVRMAMGDDVGPCDIDQGDTVIDEVLGVGEHEFMFNDDFNSPLTSGSHGQRGVLIWGCMRHFFRIFSSPGEGSSDFSAPEDSGLFQYTPRMVLENERPPVSLPPVSGLTARASRSKVGLSWVPPISSDVSSIVVYYKKGATPSVDGDQACHSASGTDSDIPNCHGGDPIFVGEPQDSSCVLRFGRICVAESPSSSIDDIFQNLERTQRCFSDIEPGKKAYFTVYTRDRYGNLSPPQSIEVDIPQSESPIGVGPEAVYGLRYDRIDLRTTTVRWFNPLLPRRFFDVHAWFDERVYLYCRATDQYGNIFLDQTKLSITTEYTFESSDQESVTIQGLCGPSSRFAFDAPSRRASVQLFKFRDTVQFNQVNLANGWTRLDISLAPASPERLACLEGVIFSVKAGLTIRQNAVGDAQDILGSDSTALSDRLFKFMTQPITIAFQNPIGIVIASSAGDSVMYECMRPPRSSLSGQSLCGWTSGENPRVILTGAYAGRKSPISLTVFAQYRKKALPAGSVCVINSFDADMPKYTSGLVDGSWEETCKNMSNDRFSGYAAQLDFPKVGLWQYVEYIQNIIDAATYQDSLILRPNSPVAQFYPLPETSTEEYAWVSGFMTGGISAADLQIQVPDISCAAEVCATVSINGFRRTAHIYTAVAPTLRVNLTARSPVADGLNVAQQIAEVYIIDPDVSNATTEEYKPVPDGTPVRWELIGFRNSRDRPFYSTSQSDDPRYAFGVWDFTVGGRSDRVYFGPASDVVVSIVTESSTGGGGIGGGASGGDNPFDGDDEDNPLGGDDEVGDTPQSITYIIPEEYVIKVSVYLSGQSASQSTTACLVPYQNDDVEDPVVEDSLQTAAIYADGPVQSSGYRNAQLIYSDGEQSAIFRIVRDVMLLEQSDQNINTDNFKSCYINDGSGYGSLPNATYVPMSQNTAIDVKIHRPLRFIEEGPTSIPYWSSPVRIIKGGLVFTNLVSTNDTTLQLELGNQTYFRVLSNAFIPLKWSRFGKPTTARTGNVTCETFSVAGWSDLPSSDPENPNNWIDYDIAVSVKADFFVSSAILTSTVYGEGRKGMGVPEKLIKFREPLNVHFGWIERGGQRLFTNEVLADGETQHSLVFVVTFSNKPVPADVDVYITSCGSELPGVSAQTLKTQIVNESGSWYEPNEIGEVPATSSVVKVAILPISPGMSFNTTVFAECNYDRGNFGSIYRQRVHGVDLSYQGGSFAAYMGGDGSGDGGSDGGSDGDSSDGSAGSPIPRPDPSELVDEAGLISRNQIALPLTATCYIHNITSAESGWTRTADMSFKKCWHGMAYVGGHFYSIGGLTTAGVTNYMERWSQSENRWKSCAKIPKPLFGMSVAYDNEYIYIVGGVEMAFLGSGSAAGFKPRCSSHFFRYSIETDEWQEMPPLPQRTDLPPSPSLGGFGGSGSNPESSPAVRHGHAFGKCIVAGDYIFALCGASNVEQNTQEVSETSKYVHIFSISANKWLGSFSVLDNDLATYGRLYPAVVKIDDSRWAFVGGSNVINEGVSYTLGNADTVITVNESREVYFTDSFMFDVSNIDSYFSSLSSSSSSSSSDSSSSSSASTARPFDIYIADSIFADIPEPRGRAAHVDCDGTLVIVGGRLPPIGEYLGTNATKKMEILKLSDGLYVKSQGRSLIGGRLLLSSAWDGESLIMVSGGVTNGKSPGFCQISIEAFGEQTESNIQPIQEGFRIEGVQASARLDGISGVDLRIRVYDDEGKPLDDDVLVELEGYIRFQGTDQEELELGMGGIPGGGPNGRIFMRRKRRGTKIFPIRIDDRLVDVSSGIGYARLAPRSEDPFRPISDITSLLGNSVITSADIEVVESRAATDELDNTISIRQGKTRFPYQVIVAARIVDDFYYGSTEFDPGAEADRTTENELTFPELSEQDRYADAGEFDSAAVMPVFSVRRINGVLPIRSTTDGGNSLAFVSTAIGVISGIGDTDLYSFVAPVNGIVDICIEPRGISTLRSTIRIYNSERQPVQFESLTGSNLRLIYKAYFDESGDPTSPPDNSSNGFGQFADAMTAPNQVYYIEVSSYDVTDTKYQVGEYRLIVSYPLSQVSEQQAFGTGQVEYPMPCNGSIDWEKLEICWEQMVPVSFLIENGVDPPEAGRETINGCEMAPHTVCVRPCLMSLSDPKSIIGVASGDLNWKILRLPPYPCGQQPQPPHGGEVCETDWPSPDCNKEIGEFAVDLCDQFENGENFLKWAWSPQSPLWMCKAELCKHCPNLCSMKSWPDFTIQSCLNTCSDPIRCNPHAEDNRIDFSCADRYWTTYLGFDLRTRSVWGQVAFGPDGNRVPTELNPIYPSYDPAAVQQAQIEPSTANFSQYLMPAVLPRLRKNFRFRVTCAVSGQVFQFSANTPGSGGDSSGSDLRLGNTSLCPFTCPSCVRNQNNVGGLSCVGSDNTMCTTVSVVANDSSFSFRSLMSGDSSSSSSDGTGGSVYLPPPLEAQLDSEALRFDLVGAGINLESDPSGITLLDLPDNPIIQYYSDLDWVPTVRTWKYEGEQAVSDAIQRLGELAGSRPFGCSPMYDAITQAAKESDIITDQGGSVITFVLTDGEENLSRLNAVEVVGELISIRGNRNSPIYFVNLADYYPITVSSQATIADQGEQRYITLSAGGGSMSIIDASSVDSVSRSAIRITRGLASGQYQAVLNFGRKVNLESLEVVGNQSAIISVSLSKTDDGISFYGTDVVATPSLPWFGDLIGDIFRINVLLTQKFPEEHESFVEALLRSVTINYSLPMETLIVSKPKQLNAAPHQIVGVAHASIGETTDVKFSAAAHLYTSWDKFANEITPAAVGGGRVIVPIRSADSFGVFVDALVKVSPHLYVSRLGPWQRGSSVVVKSGANVVEEDQYRSDADSGTVVFKSAYDVADMTIAIGTPYEGVFAFNITNKSFEQTACVDSFVVDMLEAPYPRPEYNSKPEVLDLRFLSGSYTQYDTISISYLFVDADGDQEDVEKTEIRWYKNGVEMAIVFGSKKYNDLNDANDTLYVNQFWTRNYYSEAQTAGRPAEILAAQNGESFFNIGDQVYFEVRPHDGKDFGAVVRSPVITIVSPPLRPASFTLIPKLESDRSETLNLSNMAFAFADFSFYNPTEILETKIRWRYRLSGSNEFVSIGEPRPLRASSGFGGAEHVLELHHTQVSIPYQGGPVRGFPVGGQISAQLIFRDNTTLDSNDLNVFNTKPKARVGWIGLGDLGTGTFYLQAYLSSEDIDISLNQPGQEISYEVSWEQSVSGGEFVPMQAPYQSEPNTFELISYPDGTGDFNCFDGPPITYRVTVTPFDNIERGLPEVSEHSTDGCGSWEP